VVGGGFCNRLLCQFTADACQRPVVTGPVEATALGNILIQAIASGHLSNLAEGRQAVGASFERHHCEPRTGTAWQDAYARFTRLLG
jgi:rhamnulokinase